MEIEVKSKAGHRERLKAHFIAGDEGAYSDEKLLELLLTYAIPQKDVQPLARKLIATFGSLSDVLSTDITTLCEQEGIKEHSAVLLKLIDWIRKHDNSENGKQAQIKESFIAPTLFPDNPLVTTEADIPGKALPKSPKSTASHARTGLFGKAMLHEAIDMLPQLPDTESLAVIKDFLKKHLRFRMPSRMLCNEELPKEVAESRYCRHKLSLSIKTFKFTKEGTMPVCKKKRTTSETALSKAEQAYPLLPEQQEFHQHLRILAQSAVRTVLELVMREELDAFIGAAWGECSPKRKGYRNGTDTRDLVTSSGRLEEINVPRDRAGQFHTQAFERYSRYEPHIAEGLTQMFVAGTSTHNVGEVAQTLMGVTPSASTISRLNQTLTHQFEAWRQRPLQEHWRILYLDGVHFSIRHGEKADATIILTALGVDLAGNKEVVALRACAEESKDGWACLLQDLRSRGATQIDLIVTDGHDGLLAAISELVAATPRQRCLVHTQRNVLSAIPRRERGDVTAELVGIWDQPTQQEAKTQLAAFKAKYSKRYRGSCAKPG